MPDHDPVDEPEGAEAPELRVTVTRTGGIAGMRREWCAEPAADEASTWHELIDRCPWDSGDADTGSGVDAEPGPDRFSWLIRVDEHGNPTHGASLPENRVTGPWSDLIEAVRQVQTP